MCGSSIILALKIHCNSIKTHLYLYFINVKNEHEILKYAFVIILIYQYMSLMFFCLPLQNKLNIVSPVHVCVCK